MQEQLKKLIGKALQKIKVGAGFSPDDVLIEIPNGEEFGDFSTNIAMQYAKKFGKNPREIAELIRTNFPKNDIVEKIEIAGPGFLNLFLTDQFLQTELQKFDPEKKLNLGKGVKICLDSSHPNIAKPLHFGHLRSTIIGEALTRILRQAGYDVLHDNFLGDWGTQFGKLVVAIKKWGNMDEISVSEHPIDELVRLYQKFHEEAEKNPELEKEGAEEFRKMEMEQNAENLKLWKWIVEESLREVQKFYKYIDASFDLIRGESFYEKMLPQALELLRTSGVGSVGEKGALIVQFPEETKLPPMIFQRADGATLYQTRDICRILLYEKESINIMIHVVGSDQSLHFRQLFQTAKMLGLKPQCEHTSYGLVRLPEGKMSTRKGNIVGLQEVLQEAEERVRQILKERKVDFSEEEKNALVHTLAVGAVKFNDLSQNRNTTVVFEWDKMLSFEGFSAPFLQYSYARARSIFRKDEEQGKTKFGASDLMLKEKPERQLAKKILDFPAVVLLAAEKRMPHFIAQYVYELAARFNHFYAECPILPAAEAEKKARLYLTEKMCETLKQGLYLLGINVPERM